MWSRVKQPWIPSIASWLNEYKNALGFIIIYDYIHPHESDIKSSVMWVLLTLSKVIPLKFNRRSFAELPWGVFFPPNIRENEIAENRNSYAIVPWVRVSTI